MNHYQQVNAEYWKLKKAEEKNGKPLGVFKKSQAEEYKRKHQTELNTYKIYRDTLKSMMVIKMVIVPFLFREEDYGK